MHHGAYMTEEDRRNTVETSARLLYPCWYWRNSISTCLSQLRSSPPHLCDYCEGGRIHKSKSPATTHLLPACTLLAYISLPCSIRQYCTSPHGIHCIPVPDNMYIHTELPCTVLLGELIVSKCVADMYLLTISSPNINQVAMSLYDIMYAHGIHFATMYVVFYYSCMCLESVLAVSILTSQYCIILYSILCVCTVHMYICMYNVHSFCTCFV